MALTLRVTIMFTHEVTDIVPSNMDIEELDKACDHVANQIEKKFRAAFAGEADNVVVAVEPRVRQSASSNQ